MHKARRLLAALPLLLVAPAIVDLHPGPTPALAQSRDPHLIRQGEFGSVNRDRSFKRPKHDKPLRHGKLVRGQRDIAAAWFSDPTRRYRHDPFHTGEHATKLFISMANHRLLAVDLPKDSVFEDVMPRLADLDGDGKDEIIVVRSYDRKGAALAVVRTFANAAAITTETRAIGIPMRWLNPAGIADFDGDGRPDIAIVLTPHIGGILQIWTLRGGKLELLAEERNVSNHVLGSLHLDLSAVADFDGDGRPDIALPDQQRRLLRFLTLRNGEIRTLGESWLKGPANENFKLLEVGGRPAVSVGLSGDRNQVVAPCRDISGWRMAKGNC